MPIGDLLIIVVLVLVLLLVPLAAIWPRLKHYRLHIKKVQPKRRRHKAGRYQSRKAGLIRKLSRLL